ncbi:MAG: glutamyl-tRNA reductase [Kineosporiaceae bacterium]
MSLLVVGVSHRTADLSLLERVSLDTPAADDLAHRLCEGAYVGEAMVLATCNRLEVYADVTGFHGGVAELGQQLAKATGVRLEELSDHLYVHYDAAAIAHLFSVTAGLDSMAVGEQQILGQVRAGLRRGQEGGTVGRGLDPVVQNALRVGKRAHAETDLDRAGHNLVEAGLAESARRLGPLEGLHALVIGAGSMSGLAVATLHRHGVASITVVNRTFERAQRLAAGVEGTARPTVELPDALAHADLVVSSTGAVGHVLDAALVSAARTLRAELSDGVAEPQVFVDLALPRDVAPAVAALDGVTVLDLAAIGACLAADTLRKDVGAARDLVSAEVEAYLVAARAEAVAPTVVALRRHARELVDAELSRLDSRLGADLDERVRGELAQTVHRVVEKLLHTPTVKMKELAAGPEGSSYADALRTLFGLDPQAVRAVSDPTHPGGAR